MKNVLLAASSSALLALLPTSVAAQDIQPVFDLPTMAQGQVISSTAQAQAARGSRARRGPTQAQANACANRPRLRREMGASHPDILKLNRLCRGVGL